MHITSSVRIRSILCRSTIENLDRRNDFEGFTVVGLGCNVKVDLKDFINYIYLVQDMSQQLAAVNTNKTPGFIKIAMETSDWRKGY
jgi:altronate dehydratase